MATLKKFGGARVSLATATRSDALNSLGGGLGAHGQLLIIGVPHQPLTVSAFPLIRSNRFANRVVVIPGIRR